MTIQSQLRTGSNMPNAWTALEQVAKQAIASMGGAGGHTRVITARVSRTDSPAWKWDVDVEIETTIP